MPIGSLRSSTPLGNPRYNWDRQKAAVSFGRRVVGGNARAATIKLATTRRRPMNVSYYVVVPVDRNEEGDLTAGDAQEAIGALSAERGARTLAIEHAGAVAFSRTGDPSVGEFQDAVILAQFGEVDLNALGE
jgi:hypothetical protein